MNLVANFMTPTLKDWWATRSRTALLKRKSTLEEQRAAFRGEAMLSEQQDWVIRGIRLVILAIGLAAHIIISNVLMMALFITRNAWSVGNSVGILAIGVFFLWINTKYLLKNISRVDKYWDTVSPSHLGILEQEIRDIGKKLKTIA